MAAGVRNDECSMSGHVWEKPLECSSNFDKGEAKSCQRVRAVMSQFEFKGLSNSSKQNNKLNLFYAFSS